MAPGACGGLPFAVPDWTYVPLRRPATGIFGSEKRAQSVALGFIRRVARLPGGELIIRAFDYTHDHEAVAVQGDHARFASPIGVVVERGGDDVRTVFRGMGYGFAEEPTELPTDAIATDKTTVAELIAELDDGATLLVANQAVIEQGPAVAQRVNEALAERARHNYEPARVQWLRPWTWPAWVWALWLGIAMVCAGVGAAIITFGPTLLPYDEEFLGATTDDLDAINNRLVAFLQHDRITMAGCMAAIGFNDIGFALAMRRGWRWARAGFALAGAVGFPTFFLYLGYEFFDPLHFAVAAGFFPLYLGGVFGRQESPSWRVPVEVDETVRLRSIRAQALMVMMAVGVLLSGILIMTIGLRDVLIPSDRAFLGDSQEVFAEALDGRLLRFIAHDRAGFGGALASLGFGVLTTTLWGWRAGERSTWWALGAAGFVGLIPALVIHLRVGYTDVPHLAPVYIGIAWVGAALWLSRSWFLNPVEG